MSNTNIKKVRTSDLELKDRLVSIQRVTKVTKGGRTFSFSAIVVVGNENGVVGYGLGKASEVTAAIAKGVEDAKKNLVKIPVLHGTIQRVIGNDSSGCSWYRSNCGRCYACRIGERWHPQRVGQEQGLIEPSQPGKSYHCSAVGVA